MKPAILCLNCDQFNRDLSELKPRGNRYQYLLVPARSLAEAQTWIPLPMRIQSSYVNFQGPKVDAMWERSRQHAIQVIEEARSRANVVAVMAANWDYWDEEGMRLACDAIGMPFLVLLRESYLNTYGYQENKDYFDQWIRIPQPRALAMASPATVDLFERLKLFPGVPMVATGWPRFDVWHRPTPAMLDRPVVLMSYFKGYAAEQHFLDMMVTFDDVARQHPTVPFVVKAKHGSEQERLSQFSRDRGLSVPVIDILNLPSLLCNARAVVGFNSMVMFEALLSPAHLILPYWGETAQDPDNLAPSPADTRIRDHVTFAMSEKELRETLTAAIAGRLPPVDMRVRPTVFSKYFTFGGGRTNLDRVEDFIDDALKAPH